MKTLSSYLFLGILVFISACSKNNQQTEEEKEDKYLVINPIIKSTTQKNEYVAEINAKQNVEIRTKIKGFVEKVYVDEGQNVRSGQLLFTINNILYHQELTKSQALVKITEAELKAIQIERENSKKLFDKNIVSKAEMDLAQARVDAAKAKVAEAKSDEERAKMNISFSQIKAPFDGIINRIPHKMGSLLEEGTLLTTISNNAEVYTYFNVSEKDYLDLVTGKQDGAQTSVTLMLANGMEYPFKGIIETGESEFDKSTGNIAFRAKFPNPERLLKHGGSGKIILNTPVSNAIHIPQKSTFEVQDKLYVYIVNAKEEVEQRSITPTFRIPHYYIVEENITPLDRILLEGIQSVKSGDKIHVDLISKEKAEELINQ